MLRKVLIVLGILLAVFFVAVAGLAGYVATKPDSYAITRSATIDAPPEVVFEHVNDFHKWEAWSPWAKLDPASKTLFEGADAGEGAVFKWSGNDAVGEGSMKILKADEPKQLDIDLRFVRPFEDKCDTRFTFEPIGGDDKPQTKVTWTMSGKQGFVQKAVCLFMDMDKMVGGDFERGLANLNEAVADHDAAK